MSDFLPSGYQIIPAIASDPYLEKAWAGDLLGNWLWVENPLSPSGAISLIWDSDGMWSFGAGGLRVPLYTTGTLPAAGIAGRIAFNTTTATFLVDNGGAWAASGGGGGVGPGTTNTLPIFTSSTTIGDSPLSIAGGTTLQLTGLTVASLATSGNFTLSGTAASVGLQSTGEIVLGTGGNAIRGDSSGHPLGTVTVPFGPLFLNNAITVAGISAPAASPSGAGRIYFDNGSNTFKVSEDGGAYVDMLGGGGGAVSSVTGTANQVDASPTTGAVVLSLIGPYTPATYTSDGVLYGAGTSSIAATAQGPANSVLIANASAPSFSQTPVINTSLTVGVGSSVTGKVVFNNSTNSNTLAIQAGVTGSNTTYTLPTNTGSNGDFLTTDGTGVLTWAAGSGASGITSLNGLSDAVQTFTNDANVTVVSAAAAHVITWAGQLAVARGGTGAATLTANGVVFGNGTSAVGITAQGAANSILVANAGAPSFSQTPTINTSLTVGVSSSQTGSIVLRNSTNANTLTLQPGTTSTNTAFTLPVNAGSSGNLLSTDGTGVLSWVSVGTGITSLNGLTGATQTFANDTNVTMVSSGTTHTLTWAGVLGAGRGGTGASSLTTNGVVYGNATGTVGVTAQGPANSILSANAGAPFWAQNPIINNTATIGVGSSITGQLILKNSTNANTTAIQAGAASSNLTFTLPTNAGTSGFVLTTNGAGVLSWAAGGGGGSTASAITTSTLAGLPAAGTPGSIRYVTDSIRNVHLDNGTSWTKQSGNTVDIRDFGAISGGSGTTNRLAIQAAHDALPSRGGTIFIPTGRWNIDDAINITKPCFISGQGLDDANNFAFRGSCIELSGGTDHDGFVCNTNQPVIFDNLVFVGNSGALGLPLSGTAIRFIGTTPLIGAEFGRINNCLFFSLWNGVAIESATGIHISNSIFWSIANRAVLVAHSINGDSGAYLIVNTMFLVHGGSDTPTWVSQAYGAGTIVIRNGAAYISNQATLSGDIPGSSGKWTAMEATAVNLTSSGLGIVNCKFAGGRFSLVVNAISPTIGIQQSDLIFSSNSCENFGIAGVFFERTSGSQVFINAQIDNNQFASFNSISGSCLLFGTLPVYGLSITNNLFNWAQNGIVLKDVKECLIANNTFGSTFNGGVAAIAGPALALVSGNSKIVLGANAFPAVGSVSSGAIPSDTIRTGWNQTFSSPATAPYTVFATRTTGNPIALFQQTTGASSIAGVSVDLAAGSVGALFTGSIASSPKFLVDAAGSVYTDQYRTLGGTPGLTTSININVPTHLIVSGGIITGFTQP